MPVRLADLSLWELNSKGPRLRFDKKALGDYALRKIQYLTFRQRSAANPARTFRDVAGSWARF